MISMCLIIFCEVEQAEKSGMSIPSCYISKKKGRSCAIRLCMQRPLQTDQFEFALYFAGNPVSIQGADQATMQCCKQQVAWTAESQASLADLECHVDDSTDRAAAGKVTCYLIHIKIHPFPRTKIPKDVG